MQRFESTEILVRLLFLVIVLGRHVFVGIVRLENRIAPDGDDGGKCESDDQDDALTDIHSEEGFPGGYRHWVRGSLRLRSRIL